MRKFKLLCGSLLLAAALSSQFINEVSAAYEYSCIYEPGPICNGWCAPPQGWSSCHTYGWTAFCGNGCFGSKAECEY